MFNITADEADTQKIYQIQQSESTKEVSPSHPHLQKRYAHPLGIPLSIQAAEIVGINYYTAKTILFYYKNNHKSYHFDFAQKQTHKKYDSPPTDTYLNIRKSTNPIT